MSENNNEPIFSVLNNKIECSQSSDCFSAQTEIYDYVQVDTSHPTSVDDGGTGGDLIFTPSNWTATYYSALGGGEAGCQTDPASCNTTFTWYGPTPDWNVYFTIGVAFKGFEENSSTQVYWASPGPGAVCCDGECKSSC